jgi:hypothetical protein
MNITKKIALAIAALTVASFPLVTEGCNGHANYHHHLHNTEEDCSEDNVAGILNSVVAPHRVLQDSFLRCGTAEPSRTQLRKMPQILDRWKQRVGADRRLQDVVINIPVYVHIIKRSDGTGGEVSEEQVTLQIEKLNDSYNGNFDFTLVAVDTTNNTSWYEANVDTAEVLAMQTALKQGGTDTLNLYTSENSLDYLGWVSCVCRVVSCCVQWNFVKMKCIRICHDLICIQSFSLSLSCLKGDISSWKYCRRHHRWCGGSLLDVASW